MNEWYHKWILVEWIKYAYWKWLGREAEIPSGYRRGISNEWNHEWILIKSIDPIFSKFDEPDRMNEVREGRSHYQFIIIH